MTRPKLTHMPHQEAQRALEKAARLSQHGNPDTHDCAACGVVGEGCFGFGIYRNQVGGLWACQDLECREIVKARVEAGKSVGAGAKAERDLFGAAA